MDREKAETGIECPPVPIRPARRWAHFAALNLVAIAIAAAIFLLVYHAGFLDAGSESVAVWFFDHPGVASVAATAPMLVMILIGLHSLRRGLRRRAAAREREAAAARAAAE